MTPPIFHHDAVAASLLGGAAGAATAAGVVPLPTDAPAWLAWVGALGVGVLPFFVSRLLAGAAAFPRALASERTAKARALLKDTDPKNDAQAADLLEEAARLRAVAAALDAAGNTQPPPRGEQ